MLSFVSHEVALGGRAAIDSNTSASAINNRIKHPFVWKS